MKVVCLNWNAFIRCDHVRIIIETEVVCNNGYVLATFLCGKMAIINNMVINNNDNNKNRSIIYIFSYLCSILHLNEGSILNNNIENNTDNNNNSGKNETWNYFTVRNRRTVKENIHKECRYSQTDW